MKTKFIKIATIPGVSAFAQKATQVDGDVTIKKGKYVIDGKSIMGLFSLDMSTGVTVEYPDDATNFEAYLETLAE